MAGRRLILLLSVVFGASCSGRVVHVDESDPDAAGGTGGKGGAAASAGRGGGGAGGAAGIGASSGSGGAGASSGSGGTGASSGSGGFGGTTPVDTTCREAKAIAECKTRLGTEGFCRARADCGCNSCSCELAACDQVPSCKAIRVCLARTRCCSSDQVGCVGTPCTDACAAEISAAAADQGLQLVLATSACEFIMNPCTPCPAGDSGS